MVRAVGIWSFLWLYICGSQRL